MKFILSSMSCLALTLSASPAERHAVMPEKHFEVLDKYCLDCHDSSTEKGEVNLDTLSFTLTDDIQTAELWNKVLNALNSGEMPPEDKKQISPEEKTDFLRDLSEQMVLARSILSDSGGEIALRRLNRREYANTLNVLLGVRPNTSNLPDDRANAEFDTEGASLFFSSDQLENYLATARNTLELALLAKSQRPSETIRIEPEDYFYPFYANLAAERLDRAKRYYSFLGAGGTDEAAKQFGFLDAWQGDRSSGASDGFMQVKKWLDAPENKKGAALMVTIKDGFTQMKFPQLRSWHPGKYIIRVQAAAYEDDPVRFRYLEFSRREGQNATRLGWRKVTAPLNKPQVIEFPIEHEPGMDAAYWVQKRTHMDRGDKNLHSIYVDENGYGTPWGVWIDWVELEGPLPEEPNPAVAEILFKQDASQSEEDYAREVIRRFAVKAFRGETPETEFIDKLVKRFQTKREEGEKLTEALIDPLAIVLSSPSFLYMVEATGDSSSEELSGTELATRLSYFLWSEPPDETLLSLAKEGRLKKHWNLRKQTRRLLADPRSDRFIRSFTFQWLEMYRLGMFAFEGRDYPKFDNATRDCAGEEIYQTVSTLLHEKLPLSNLLDSDFVVLNDVLADYYEIDGVEGHHWRKVPVPEDSPRGGLIASAAVAAMGSDGQRSSPVERGVWVLRKLLNDPPPPPPPNVPQLSRFEDEILSSRDLVKIHQEEPQCAQCHQKIDPIGFGMENFDAAGIWRETDIVRGRKQKFLAEFPIDPSGSIGQDREFSNFFELREEVAEEIDAFAMGLTEALITYALGRPFGFTDHDLAQEILSHADENEYQLDEFIHALVQTKTFQSK
ncbi:MAG: DUF1592 domain-containing protein [Verrucomicrobiota bacterium]